MFGVAQRRPLINIPWTEAKHPCRTEKVLDKHKLLAPRMMVKLLRLNLFIRIATGGNVAAKAIAFAAKGPRRAGSMRWRKIPYGSAASMARARRRS